MRLQLLSEAVKSCFISRNGAGMTGGTALYEPCTIYRWWWWWWWI